MSSITELSKVTKLTLSFNIYQIFYNNNIPDPELSKCDKFKFIKTGRILIGATFKVSETSAIEF